MMANQMQHSNRQGPPDDSWDKWVPEAGEEGPPKANVRTSRDQILRDVSEDWNALVNLNYDDFVEDLRITYDTVVCQGPPGSSLPDDYEERTSWWNKTPKNLEQGPPWCIVNPCDMILCWKPLLVDLFNPSWTTQQNLKALPLTGTAGKMEALRTIHNLFKNVDRIRTPDGYLDKGFKKSREDLLSFSTIGSQVVDYVSPWEWDDTPIVINPRLLTQSSSSGGRSSGQTQAEPPEHHRSQSGWAATRDDPRYWYRHWR